MPSPSKKKSGAPNDAASRRRGSKVVRFGNYLLLEPLATGGMGEVHLAKSGLPGFERYFAVKRILAEHLESEAFIDALIDEARIVTSLSHPNIAQVFEFGRIDGHFFIAMEYVEAISLRQAIDQGTQHGIRMSYADAIYITMQLCRALEYAHNKTDAYGSPLGIIHRDVSPHNVLLDIHGSVKLIDFGVAKAATNAQKTKEGFVKGKVSYMSPEQARGERIDRRTDIYALGVDLIEMLTYRQAVGGRTMLERLANAQAGRMVDFAPHLTDAPASLIKVIHRAVAPEKERRFQKAADMEQALATVLGTLDPGHTPQNLARLVARLDHDREGRAKRMRRYAEMTGDTVRDSKSDKETRPARSIGLRIALIVGVLVGAATAALALWLR